MLANVTNVVQRLIVFSAATRINKNWKLRIYHGYMINPRTARTFCAWGKNITRRLINDKCVFFQLQT